MVDQHDYPCSIVNSGTCNCIYVIVLNILGCEVSLHCSNIKQAAELYHYLLQAAIVDLVA